MRNYAFTPDERPTMANFNQRFQSISDLADGLGNEYVWEKSYISVSGEETTSSYGITSTSYSNITYAKSIDENLSLYDTFVPAYPPGSANSEYWESLLPFYIKSSGGYIMKVTRFGTFYESSVGAYGEENLVVTKQTTYVNSADPNAYPPAEPDGYTYKALGQFGNKVQIEIGSYVGTEQSGVNNQNVLTFGFKPILVVISGIDGTGVGSFGFYMWDSENLKVIYSERVATCTATVEGNTLSWYASSYLQQLNAYNSTYKYIAIG